MNPTEIKTAEMSEINSMPIQRSAVELLIRFYILAKNVRIYDRNNALCRDQARNFFEHLQGMFEQCGGEVSFVIRHNSIFMNRVRLKFGLGNYTVFKSMHEEFRKRSIGTMRFLEGLTMEELLSFVRIFSIKDKSEEFSFVKFIDAVEDAGIIHVFLEKAIDRETFSGTDVSTARIYFLSIIHLKESFEHDRKQEPIKLNTTRRLMQSIYNHIVDNESFVLGMTSLKNYHEYTLNHSVNVCALAMALGRRLGLSRSELVELGISAFFHDLGKLDTPVDILNKPGKLDPGEWEIMEKHPCQGAEKLVHLKEFRRLPLRAIHVALEHHLKEDFTGYPKYFARDRVNLFSRIVKVVDYFDAITTPRIYRPKTFTRTEALNLMLEQSGREFNPLILKTFANMLGYFPIGSFVALDTGETAIVIDTNPETRFLLRPLVKLVTDAAGNKVNGEMADLSETDPATRKYARTITKPLDPLKYGIKVSDYFLAMADEQSA